ncbi:thyrostimulin alpha-2 subunit-like isoform X2 [Apostichopus japonicus]
MNGDIQVTFLVTYMLLTSFYCSDADGTTPSWEQPGCHLVGFAKLIELDNCRTATVPVNACRGFCLSYSYPSDYERYITSNQRQRVITTGTCCSIIRTHDVNVVLNCINNQQRSITMKSAAECSCSLCEL